MKFTLVSDDFSIKSLILQIYSMLVRKNHEASPGHSGSAAPSYNCYSFLALSCALKGVNHTYQHASLD